MLIVPTNSPGVTIRPLYAMYGGHTCETFYDDVRVPKENVVGGVNQGWGIVMHALNHERVGLAATGALARMYDQLVPHLARAPARAAAPTRWCGAAWPSSSSTCASTARWPCATPGSSRTGGTPIAEASMAKVSGTELRTRIANTAMDLLGREGGAQRQENGAHAPASTGAWSGPSGISPIFRFGGGTNEVHARHHRRRGTGPAAIGAGRP